MHDNAPPIKPATPARDTPEASEPSATGRPDPRRRCLIAATCTFGAAACAATVIPMVMSLAPRRAVADADTAPTLEIDLSTIVPGQMQTLIWHDLPIWLLRRTDAQLAALPHIDPELADPGSERPGFTPAFARNPWRSRRPDLLVVVGLCTHLGCSPILRATPGPQNDVPDDWQGGFVCPCHGSIYDLAGRVYRDQPAPDNLRVPPYDYLTDTRLVLGASHDT